MQCIKHSIPYECFKPWSISSDCCLRWPLLHVWHRSPSSLTILSLRTGYAIPWIHRRANGKFMRAWLIVQEVKGDTTTLPPQPLTVPPLVPSHSLPPPLHYSSLQTMHSTNNHHEYRSCNAWNSQFHRMVEKRPEYLLINNFRIGWQIIYLFKYIVK